MQVAISCAANSILSFLVFWLVFGAKMKEYPIHNCTDMSAPHCHYFRAPIYLGATVIGMVALVFAENIAIKLGLETKKSPTYSQQSTKYEASTLLPATYSDPSEAPLLSLNDDAAASTGKTKKTGFFVFMMGLVLSIMCGVFAAAQFGVITIGKDHVYKMNHCNSSDTKACPATVIEAFDNHGSWLVSFGMGALAFTLILLSIASVFNIARGKPRPSLHWDVLQFAGVGAGSCWALANFLQLSAVVAGGNATVMAQTLSAQIIASGLFGIFFYKEGGGKGAKATWFVAALWTLGAMVLLGLEKGKKNNPPGPHVASVWF